jgi:hypothetical protein
MRQLPMTYTAQIGLVPHPHTPLEWLIDEVTHSPVHHSVLAISETYCVSAEARGVRVRRIDYFPEAYWSAFDLSGEERDTIVDFGIGHIGRPYGWFTDAAIGISVLAKEKTPAWVENYLNDDRWYECAQLCEAAYAAAKRPLFEGVTPAEVFPGMFVPIWRRHEWMP